ncbi:MAG: lysophospholipid acyltransferase family protein [Bacteroidales bacterium]
MKIVSAFFFYFGVFLIGILPFPLLYIFSNLLRIVLHRVIKYRVDIVRDNLTNAFPEKSKSDLIELEKLVYKNLADIFLEGIKSFSLSTKQINKRHRVLNPQILDSYLNNKQDILGVTGHFANWEWGSLSASTQINASVVAFYKKLNNKYIDRFVRKSRAKFGTILASIDKTSKAFEVNIGRKTVFVMAADQNTIRKNLNKSHWFNFFGRSVPFLHGPEKYATLYNLPVVFIDIVRVERGYYEVELSTLAEKPSELPEGEITRRYAQALENRIRRKPEEWLWSHKRWKFAK